MNIKVIFWFKTAIINTSYKFIHSYLLLLKQQICQCKTKCVLCQHWNTLADYFWGLIQSFAAPKLLWEGLPSLTPPPIMPYLPITYFFSYFYFFTSPPHHPITQYFEILKCPSLHPFVTEEKIKRGGGGGGGGPPKKLTKDIKFE